MARAKNTGKFGAGGAKTSSAILIAHRISDLNPPWSAACPDIVLLGTLVPGDKCVLIDLMRPLRYERVYLPLCQVADTPFHIQREVI